MKKNITAAPEFTKIGVYSLSPIGIAVKNGANFVALKADTTLSADFSKLNDTIQSLFAAVSIMLDVRRNTANASNQTTISDAEKIVKAHFDFLCLQIGSRTLESGITKGIYKTRAADFAILGELFENSKIGCNNKRYDFSVFASSIVNLLHEFTNGKTDMNRCDAIGLTQKANEQLHAAIKERNSKAAETKAANKATRAAAEKNESAFKAYATTLIKSLSAGDNLLYGKAIELIINSHATTEEKRAIIAALGVDKSISNE